MCSLHLTHPSVHTWSSGQPTVQRPGSSRGLPVGAGIRTHNLGLPRVSSPTLYPLGQRLQWLCAQGSYHSLQGPGSEPASAAPGGGRPSPGFALSSSRLATIHRQNSKPQDLRPALCLLRRPAEGKGCLQAEDGPLDSGCHCLGLPSSRRALPAQVACPLYERRGILLGVGSWRLADRYL